MPPHCCQLQLQYPVLTHPGWGFWGDRSCCQQPWGAGQGAEPWPLAPGASPAAAGSGVALGGGKGRDMRVLLVLWPCVPVSPGPPCPKLQLSAGGSPSALQGLSQHLWEWCPGLPGFYMYLQQACRLQVAQGHAKPAPEGKRCPAHRAGPSRDRGVLVQKQRGTDAANLIW